MPQQLDKSDLLDLLEHEGMKLLFLEVEACVEDIENAVLKLSLDDSNSQELLIRKARAEGARRAADALTRRLNKLRSGKS